MISAAHYVLAATEVVAFGVGMRFKIVRLAYPLFLLSLLPSILLLVTYEPHGATWLHRLWMPLELAAVLLRMLAAFEAVKAQRVPGLVLACTVLALFDVSLCSAIAGTSALANTVQLRRLIQVFYECVLLSAVLIPRTAGARRGKHIVMLAAIYLPSAAISVLSMRGAWSGNTWAVAALWCTLATTAVYAVWSYLVIRYDHLQTAYFPFDSSQSF